MSHSDTHPEPQQGLRAALQSLDVEFLHGVPVKLPSSTIDEIIAAVDDSLPEKRSYEFYRKNSQATDDQILMAMDTWNNCIDQTQANFKRRMG